MSEQYKSSVYQNNKCIVVGCTNYVGLRHLYCPQHVQQAQAAYETDKPAPEGEVRLEDYQRGNHERGYLLAGYKCGTPPNRWLWTEMEQVLGEPDIYFLPYDPTSLARNARLYQDVDVIVYTDREKYDTLDGKMRFFERIDRIKICKKRLPEPQAAPQERTTILRYYLSENIEMATVGCFHCPQIIKFWTLAFVHGWPIICPGCGLSQEKATVKKALGL